MVRWLPACVISTTLMMGAAADSAWAWWHDVPWCAPVPLQFVEQTVTCYRPEYRTEYREVQRTVYRCVPETHEQEIR